MCIYFRVSAYRSPIPHETLQFAHDRLLFCGGQLCWLMTQACCWNATSTLELCALACATAAQCFASIFWLASSAVNWHPQDTDLLSAQVGLGMKAGLACNSSLESARFRSLVSSDVCAYNMSHGQRLCWIWIV